MRAAVPSSRRAFSSNNRIISGFESLNARTRYFAAQTKACSIIIAALSLVIVTTQSSAQPRGAPSTLSATTALGTGRVASGRRARIGSETTYGWLANPEGAARTPARDRVTSPRECCLLYRNFAKFSGENYPSDCAQSIMQAGMPAMQEPITQTEGQAESAPCIPRR